VLDVVPAAVTEKTAVAVKMGQNRVPAINGNGDLKVDKIRSAEDCRSLDLLAPTKSFFQLINIQNLEDTATVETGSSLDKTKLKALGLIKKEDKAVKLLGKGKLSKKLKIEVDMASASAAEAVKRAGGEVVTTG